MSQTNNSAPPSEPSQSPTIRKPPRLALLIATGFGLGHVSRAPGTLGSILGLVIWTIVGHPATVMLVLVFAIDQFPESQQRYIAKLLDAGLYYWWFAVTVGIALVGVWAANQVAKHRGVDDPQEVIVDEISGQQLALLLGACWHGPAFRQAAWDFFADVQSAAWRTKPVSYPDLLQWKYLVAGFILFRIFDIWKPWPVRQAEKLPGGWGIMADDWVAGIYAAICLWGLRMAGL